MEKREKEDRKKNELVKVLRLEISTVISRTNTPPKMRGSAFDVVQATLAPYTSTPAWIPEINQKTAHGKWVKGCPKTPGSTFFEILRRAQTRVRFVGNETMTELLCEHRKPEMAKTKGEKRPFGYVANEGERPPLATLAYRHVVKNYCDDTFPYINAATCSVLAQGIYGLFKKWIKEGQRETLSTIGAGWPLWIRKDTWLFTREHGLNLAFNLDGTWWEVGLRIPRKNMKQPADPFVMRALSRLIKGEPVRGTSTGPTSSAWLAGNLGLQCKNGKWYVLIQYRQPRPKVITGTEHIVIHCGLRNFLLALSLNELLQNRYGIRESGIDLINTKARFRARTRDKQQAAQRKGGSGHGYAHTKADLQNLRDKEHAWTMSWLRRVAKQIVRKAAVSGSTLHLMDLENIRTRAQNSDLPGRVKVRVHQAPWFAFRTYVTQAAETMGVAVETFEGRYHTQRCPSCLSTSPASPDYKKWKFVCLSCGYSSNDIDRVAVANAFVDLGLLAPQSTPGQEVNPTKELHGLYGLDKAVRERRSAGERQNKKSRKVSGIDQSKISEPLESPLENAE